MVDGLLFPRRKERIDFKNYEIRNEDLETLAEDLDILCQSGLIDKEFLDNIRFVTYDSKSLYIFTRGEHESNERFKVEEIPSVSKTGFRVFKIDHFGFIGRNEESYAGARAWLLCDEVETTAKNAKKFPNENILYEPDKPQPEEILDVVSISPEKPFAEIWKGEYDYLADLVFHEAAHIEYRRLRNWQKGKIFTEEFSSEEQKNKFLSVIKETKIFPEWMINLIVDNISRKALGEMYAMLIDREACKRYNPKKFERDNAEFRRILKEISENNTEIIKQIKKLSKSVHIIGRLLVMILEEKFPIFEERKNFVHSVLFEQENQNINNS